MCKTERKPAHSVVWFSRNGNPAQHSHVLLASRDSRYRDQKPMQHPHARQICHQIRHKKQFRRSLEVALHAMEKSRPKQWHALTVDIPSRLKRLETVDWGGCTH